MSARISTIALTALSLIAGVVPGASVSSASTSPGAKDAVVVAVIDSAFTPYHWDFLASKMPQATNTDPSDDLPLDRAPHEWLTGFPSPGSFRSYNRLDLTLENSNPNMPISGLDAADKAKWDSINQSDGEGIDYYWLPGTKVIGAMTFSANTIHGNQTAHGTGTTSVSVGNLHGTCPECLLVFIQLGGEDIEAATNWALSQPWIDVVSHSFGFDFSSNLPGGNPGIPSTRERFYNGHNSDKQRKASERGQTIFFSAGNGISNTFTIPNSTLFSSQEGPDWIVTVGAVSPGEDNSYSDPTRMTSHSSYTGHGKPADISGIGSDYPSAYSAPTVGGTGSTGFSGTSNATPQIAGIYARGLYFARKALGGPSRVQKGGVVASGDAIKCGSKNPRCELADGKLTAVELRTRLFHGAVHTAAGMTAGGYGPGTPPIGEEEFLNEGHGSYFGREYKDPDVWVEEFERFIGPMFGRLKPLERPEGELEWMIVDSFCRQHLWGAWKNSYYLDGKTELPGQDGAYPIRSMIEATCPYYTTPP